MAFITEFLQHQIKQHMEDPDERRQKWEDHVRRLENNSKKRHVAALCFVPPPPPPPLRTRVDALLALVRPSRSLTNNGQRRKEEWTQPTKPWGFWQSDKANAKCVPCLL